MLEIDEHLPMAQLEEQLLYLVTLCERHRFWLMQQGLNILSQTKSKSKVEPEPNVITFFREVTYFLTLFQY